MKYHPFCGAKVSTKLKMLIAFDLIVSAIALQFAIIALVLILGLDYKLFTPTDLGSLEDSPITDISLSTVVIFAIFMIIDMMLDVWLWIIIPKKDNSKCQIWFIMKLTLELCDAVGFLVEAICGHHTSTYIAIMTLDFFYTAFFLWAVFAFMVEIKTSPKNLLQGNKFVKFFKGSNRNNVGNEETNALKSVMED